MDAGAFDAIDDDPEIVLDEDHRAAMHDGARMTAVAVVLSLDDRRARRIARVQQRGLGPVEHFELPMMPHLIEAVDRHRVVARRPHEVLMPLGRGVVLKAAGVDEHVQPAPPHVEVQHVDLREPIAQRAAAKRREAARIAAAQHVRTGRGE